MSADIFRPRSGRSGGKVRRPTGARSPLALEKLESRALLSGGPELVLSEIIADICPGGGGADIRDLTDVNGAVFFTADDGTHGRELWKTDGTASGTMLVRDIRPGMAGSEPVSLTNVDGTLFFVANDGKHGWDLWKSDGTAEGTMIVQDANAGWSSDIDCLTNVDGTLFFVRVVGFYHHELWKSDGTEAGTVLVRELVPLGYYVSNATNIGGTLYFSYEHYPDDLVWSIWKSDGTAAGTTPFFETIPFAHSFTELEGSLCFIGESMLWRSDGTTDGTTSIADHVSRVPPVNVGETLFFDRHDETHGYELWKTDGTEAGTELVRDIWPGPEQSNIRDLTDVNGTLFFTADNGSHNEALWKSDGSELGTVLVSDICSHSDVEWASTLVNVSGRLFFTVHYEYGEAWQVYTSDGTPWGTRSVSPYYLGPGPYNLGQGWPGAASSNGRLFFGADDGYLGHELWVVRTPPVVESVEIGAGRDHLIVQMNDDDLNTARATDPAHFRLVAANGDADGNGNAFDDGDEIEVTIASISYSSDSDQITVWTAGVLGDDVFRLELDGDDATSDGTVGITDAAGNHLHGGDAAWHVGATRDFRIEMLDDINRTPTNSGGAEPTEMAAVGDTLFFAANDGPFGVHPGEHGWELWATDGTEQGTYLVRNIAAYSTSSDPAQFTDVDGRLFFTCNDGVHGRELWTSDGTEEGTFLLRDIVPGENCSAIDELTSFGGRLFFQAYDGVHGPELWTSDGTPGGTVMVLDAIPGAGGSSPRGLTVVDETLFFSTWDSTHAYRLWTSDGTEAGTVPIKGFLSPLNDMTDVDGTLLFVSGSALWKSDGTPDGTVIVQDNFPSTASIEHLFGMNGTLYFVVDHWTDGAALWKSDGTESGTEVVKHFGPGKTGVLVDSLDDANGRLFFWVREDSHYQLWTSDGTGTGTALVKAPFAGRGNGMTAALGGALLFAADDGEHGEALWISDGTPEGTTMVCDPQSGTRPVGLDDFTLFGDRLFFRALHHSASIGELWTSDGTEAGTVMLKDILPPSHDSFPNDLTDVDGMLFFTADDAVHGRELWASNLTTDAAVLLDIRPGSGGSWPGWMTSVGGRLLFTADDGTHGCELWTSDGTPEGTVMVNDIRPGSGSSQPSNLVNVGGSLFFTIKSAGGTFQLWTSDGTSDGTVMVSNAFDGYYALDELTDVDGRLFFGARNDQWRRELWASDGTPEGTVMIMDVGAGVDHLTNVDGRLFFRGYDPGTGGFDPNLGYGLWTSDGTPGGTYRINGISPGRTDCYPEEFTNVDGRLFFTADDGTHGRELWTSNGTDAGTWLVEDLIPGSGSSNPEYLASFRGRLFFAGADPEHGVEFWTSDGTDDGTFMVKEIKLNQGLSWSSFPNDLTVAGGTLFFFADDGFHGFELWQSDGTAAGTAMVQDIHPFNVPGFAWPYPPEHLTAVGGSVAFAADTGRYGYEPWIARAPNTPPSVNAGDDQTAAEGAVAGLPHATFADPDALDTHTALIDWGDGTDPEPGIVSERTVSGSHVYADDGVYEVTVTVTDNRGDWHSDSLLVTVTNAPPVVEAGENQQTTEGTLVNLDPATFTDPGVLDSHTAVIDWGDGTGSEPGVVGEGTVSGSHVYADDGVYEVTVTVTDDEGDWHSDSIFVTAANAPPTVALTGPTDGVRGQLLHFVADFADAGTADTHTALVDWGDGSPEEPGFVLETPFGPPGATSGMVGTAFAGHIYTETGTYTVAVTVLDDDGLSAVATIDVTIGATLVQADPLDPGKTLLLVGGSTAADKIQVKKGNKAGTLELAYTGSPPQQLAAAVDRIVIFGQDGHDDISIGKSLGPVPVEIYGNEGDDKLAAGNGNALLVGGAGDDELHGHVGRDILIGGTGEDQLLGGPGEDILVAGVYEHESRREALFAIMSEWSRIDLAYAERIASLAAGVGPEGAFALNESTVFDDAAADKLRGLEGLDWFFGNTEDDKIDPKRLEHRTITDLILQSTTSRARSASRTASSPT